MDAERIRALLAELQRLNRNLEALVEVLSDLRTMLAAALGWHVVEER